MAGEKSMYLVLQGDYTVPAMQDEIWQTGIRLFASPGGAPDPVGTLANTFDVVYLDINITEDTYRIFGNWQLEGGANDFDPGTYLQDQVGPAAATLIQSSTFAEALRLRYAKIYVVDNTGHSIAPPPYAAGSPVTLEWTGPAYPEGGGGASLMPPQNSIVASTRTQQTGRRGRGRMFLPGMPTSSLDGSGLIASTPKTNAAEAVAQFLTDITISTDTEGFNVAPAVISIPGVTYALINAVRVGDVVDTQRRRRNQLVEVYTSAPVPAP